MTMTRYFEVTTPCGYCRIAHAEGARAALRVTLDEYPATAGDSVTVRWGDRLLLWMRHDGRRWRRLDGGARRSVEVQP